MAHFHGTVQGNRLESSRIGTKNSGIQSTVNGWNIGVSVEINHIDGHDVVSVYKTAGSNGNKRELIIEYN